jgi:hypothetical protein
MATGSSFIVVRIGVSFPSASIAVSSCPCFVFAKTLSALSFSRICFPTSPVSLSMHRGLPSLHLFQWFFCHCRHLVPLLPFLLHFKRFVDTALISNNSEKAGAMLFFVGLRAIVILIAAETLPPGYASELMTLAILHSLFHQTLSRYSLLPWCLTPL